MVKKNLFLCGCICAILSCCKSPSKNKIAIQPYYPIDSVVVIPIKNFLAELYSCDVILLERKDLPQRAFVKIKSPRYRADTIIQSLKKTKPDSIDFVLGLTNMDISTTKKDKLGRIKKPIHRYQDWGIFGLGYRPGPSSIVSGFRLKHKNRKRFIQRLMKVSAHEVGHNLGLKHCPNKNCLMTDACERIQTIDKVQMDLCTQCKTRI